VAGEDYIYDIILLKNGNVMALGQTNSQNGDLVFEANFDYFYVGWVLEIELYDGEIADTKKIAWTGHDEWNTDEIIEGVEASDDSGYYFLGLSTHTFSGADFFWLIKMSPDWEVVWQKELGCLGQNSAYSMTETDSATIVFTGIIYSSDGDVTEPVIGGYGDIWIAEADSSGNIINQKIIGGTQSETIYKVNNDGNGHLLLSGFTRSVDFYGQGDTTTVADFWVLSMNMQLDTLWTLKQGGTQSDILTDIAVNNGNIFVTGRSESSDLFLHQNYGLKDLWVAKFENPYVLAEQTQLIEEVNIYPNPSSGSFTLALPQGMNEITEISFYNSSGKLIKTQNCHEGQSIFHNLPKGYYILKIRNDKKVFFEKLVVL